ncbi:MAG: type III pantothenate kinase [Halioglobus sp.]|nr:type III pantothenate kinase [Halioglobus sp.]
MTADICLQFDMGNSSAKWRLVSDAKVLLRGQYACGDRDSLAQLANIHPAPQTVWIASVASPSAEAELAAAVTELWSLTPWFARSAARSRDLVNSYREPARMGVDRWLAMLGARARTQTRLCVVDAGSALTIDLVAADGVHEGGYIIPGLALMERALLLDTHRVRFDDDTDYALSPGTSTAEAVRHGIALAQAGAVTLALDCSGGEPPALFFCGGAGATLMSLLCRGGTHIPDLVFEGLEIMASLADDLTTDR